MSWSCWYVDCREKFLISAVSACTVAGPLPVASCLHVRSRTHVWVVMVKMSEKELSNSALFKRAEQLRRWEESDTNREAGVPKMMVRKIQFSPECVFLAACAAGDKEEVRRLLDEGADINTTDADDMTALHQVLWTSIYLCVCRHAVTLLG
ncbi:hypothetical protein PR048_031849 [Dryococelus australis]|uniref:Uncharacterized protein n=1 Tax=Dryococelus australis TaxID=614101 RepID=A0ABQ9G6G2_9NEOP|nr:hypothetical protein PR048_031849 [Dryococelus australis]